MRASALLAAAVAVLALAFLTWRDRTGAAAAPPREPAVSEVPNPRALPAELRAPSRGADTSRSEESAAAAPEAPERPGSGAGLEDAGGPVARAFGFVRRADGRPLPGVVVVAASVDARRDQVLTRSDARGRYELPLAEGRWRLVAVTHGFARGRAELRVAPGAEELDGPTLVLLEGSTIRGRVLDEHDQPVAGISVACADEENGAWHFFAGDEPVEYGLHHVNSDQQGRFEFVGLEDAAHSLYARLHLRPELIADPESVTGVRAGEQDVVLRVRAPLRFIGRAVNAATGEPLESIRFDGAPVETDEGRFEVPVHGQSAPRVAAPGYHAWQSPVVAAELGPGEQLVALEPDLDTARLELRVVDEQGNALPEVSADAWSVSGRSFVESSGAGSLVIEDLAPATYRLRVSARGHLSREIDVALRAGADERRTVALAPGHPLRVRVRDALERALENARLRVEHLDGTPVGGEWTYDHASRGATLWISTLRLPTEPDAWAEIRHEVDGRIEGLPVGDYRLELRASTGEQRSIPFSISADGERELLVDL